MEYSIRKIHNSYIVTQMHTSDKDPLFKEVGFDVPPCGTEWSFPTLNTALLFVESNMMKEVISDDDSRCGATSLNA